MPIDNESESFRKITNIVTTEPSVEIEKSGDSATTRTEKNSTISEIAQNCQHSLLEEHETLRLEGRVKDFSKITTAPDLPTPPTDGSDLQNSRERLLSKVSLSFDKALSTTKAKLSLLSIGRDIVRRIMQHFPALGLFDKRTQTTLQTQEHLGRHGSMSGLQLKEFTGIVSNSDLDSGVRDKVLKELKNSTKSEARYVQRQILSTLGVGKWANEQVKKLQELQVGEGLLLDATSNKAGHGMMMRIVKEEDSTYSLYFSNTGAGILENKDFHPKKTEGDKVLVQVVSTIRGIPQADLENGNFFKEFAEACDTKKEIPATGNRKDENQLEDKDIINSMYDVLRTLTKEHGGKGRLEENDNFYSVPQYGTSCVPSSIWAILKTYENDGLNVDKMKFETALDSAMELYNKIKMGEDSSNTGCVEKII